MQIVTVFVVLLLFSNSLVADSDQQYLEEARQFLHQGEVKAAIIQLKNLLRNSPLNADARLLLGESYVKLGDGPSAIKELQKARDLRLAKVQWIIPLAQAYLMSGQPRKVIDGLGLDDSHPKQLRAQLRALRGNAHLSLREFKSAKSEYDSALELDSSSSPAFLGKASLALLNKQFEQAVEYANKSIKLDETNARAWILLGEVNRVNRQQEESLKAFDKAIELQPNNPKARVGRAVVLIASEQYQEAQKDIDQVQETVGDYPPALYLQGLIAFQNNKLQEAENLLVKVVSVLPNHLPSQLLLGTIAYSQKELESADSYLSGYVRAIPGHLPATKLLAAVRMKLKRPEEAVQLLERLQDAGENDPQFLALLGSAYMQNREFDKGTEKLSRAAELAPDVAAIHAQLALGQIASGKLDEAVGELENAVDLGQGLVQADVLLVMTLLQQKKYDNAIEAAERMAKKVPDNPMPANLMAAAYLAKGDVELAEKHWKHALSIKPDYATAALNLARLETKRNNLKKAAKWYDRILDKQPENMRALIGMAQIAEQQKDYEKMVEWLQSARDKNPDALEPMLMLTKFYLVKGKPLPALEIARDLHSRHPDNLLALKSLGLAQSAAGQDSSALSSFRKLTRGSDKNPEYHHLLARQLYKDGQIDKANREWDKALELSPTYLPAAVARSESALRAKQYQKAMEISKDIQRHYPKSPVGFQQEGDAERGMKHLSKAKSAYQLGYQNKQTAALARRLFQTYKALGEEESAFSVLEGWLEKAKNDVSSWMLLAMGYQQKGENSKAISAYQKAYELEPENHVIVNNLAWLYHETGDKRSVNLAEKALTLAENDPQVADTVGWIFVQNGKEKRGLVLLQQAAVLAPHLAEIRLHLAEALIKTSRKEEARKELKRLLKEKRSFPERKRAEQLLNSL